MADGKFTESQRAACFERAVGACEVCGYRLPEKGWNLHHRRARGMGGTRRKVSCADGLVVCGSGTQGCHGQIETNRAWALQRGYLVSKWEEPVQVPVFTARGAWVIFNHDGSTSPAPLIEGVPF